MNVYPTRNEMVAELVKPDTVGAEIGVYRGDFSLELLKTPLKRLHLIDSWKAYDAYSLDSLCHTNQDANYTDTLSRLAGPIKSGRVVVTRGFSTHVAKTWKEKLKWLFLDGNHAYEFAKDDLAVWSPHIEEDGFIMCHDYTETSAGAIAMKFGVVRAVNEFCAANGWEVFAITQEGDWPSCAIRRKS